jgi:hypothetical protein
MADIKLIQVTANTVEVWDDSDYIGLITKTLDDHYITRDLIEAGQPTSYFYSLAAAVDWFRVRTAPKEIKGEERDPEATRFDLIEVD